MYFNKTGRYFAYIWKELKKKKKKFCKIVIFFKKDLKVIFDSKI